MEKELKIGIVGFDTSHVSAFTGLLNDKNAPYHVPGGKVVAGYPSYSRDLEASFSRVEGFKKELTEKWGLTLTASIEELLEKVDAVLIESVDARRHPAESVPVIKAKKPLFIDKPLALSYKEAAKIYNFAKENGVPVFSSSSLRFDANVTKAKEDPDLKKVLFCDAFSPAPFEPTNPGLFWYGVHGVEILFTFLGAGCRKVFSQNVESGTFITGVWNDGRTGSLRGVRKGLWEYGATVFAEKKIAQLMYSKEIPIYSQLLKRIVPFFHGGRPPVSSEETLEIMAFMEAALLSEKEKREVDLSEITAGV